MRAHGGDLVKELICLVQLVLPDQTIHELEGLPQGALGPEALVALQRDDAFPQSYLLRIDLVRV